jgi:hypothetical protein
MEGDLKRNETVSPMAGKTPSVESAYRAPETR